MIEWHVSKHITDDALLKQVFNLCFRLRFNRTVENSVGPLAQDFRLGRIGRVGTVNVSLDSLGVKQVQSAPPINRKGVSRTRTPRQDFPNCFGEL